MEIDAFIQMLSVLPRVRNAAMTRTQIKDAFYSKYPEKDEGVQPTSRQRKTDHRVTKMMDIGLLQAVPNGDRARRQRYYLAQNNVLSYFLNSAAALKLIWARQMLAPLKGIHGDDPTSGFEENARLSQRERMLRDRVRIVPDGVGRLHAQIDNIMFAAMIDALERGYQVHCTYVSSQGVAKTLDLTVLGLVAKDGTVYVLGCQSFDDPPRHYAMQRFKTAYVVNSRALPRDDFDIDQYITSQHQLAHVYQDEESPIQLKLKVRPEALFHFRERPISGGQTISTAPDPDGWFDVVATVPYTVMLAPFLWSHAGWIQVMAPASLRQRVADGIRAASKHYANDGGGT